MLLSSSSEAINASADPAAVMDADGGDAGVPFGDELVAFTTAAHRLDDTLAPAREALASVVGRAGMVDAAMTAAIFRGLNIAADTSGIRVDDRWEGVAKDLMTSIGTGRFRTAANSPALASAD